MPPLYDFEWNAQKASANQRKHGVSFEEAVTVFDDTQALIQNDELHSDAEPRLAIIGFSTRQRLLVVSFVQRGLDRIRIISARLATPRERTIYEE